MSYGSIKCKACNGRGYGFLSGTTCERCEGAGVQWGESDFDHDHHETLRLIEEARRRFQHLDGGPSG